MPLAFWIPAWHQYCGCWPHQCQESLTQWEILRCRFNSVASQLDHLLKCSDAGFSLPSRPQQPSNEHAATLSLCPLACSFIYGVVLMRPNLFLLTVSPPLPHPGNEAWPVHSSIPDAWNYSSTSVTPRKYLLDA